MSSFTFAASPADVTREVTRGLDLPRTSLRIYRALHTVAVELCRLRQHDPNAKEVAFFVPAEVVAHALGIHRCTLYEHLKVLKARGLVDARAHYTTHRGRTVADGTIWGVKLNPRQGRAAKLSWYQLKGKFRDLSMDIEVGRTAWMETRQSSTQKSKPAITERLLSWALPRDYAGTPLLETVGFGLDALLDVPYARRRDRGEAVNTAAKAMASALRDDSLDFYRWLLWRLLRRWDRTPEDHWHSLHEMVLRASADREEGFARSAGALFVSRLKRWALWGDLRVMTDLAVGPPPT